MLRRRCFTALGGGLVLPFAFAPYGWWPLAMLSLAILLLSLHDLRALPAAAVGWCYGLGMFGYGVWWIQVSVHQFGLPYYAFSISVTALLVVAMAAYPALFAYSLRRLPASGEAVRVLLLAPALWVLSEWLRGTLFTGFPWLAVGYSQIDAPLAGLAPLVGVWGCSLAVVGIAAALAYGVHAGNRARVQLLAVPILLCAAGALLREVEWTQELRAGLDVALVQGDIPQDLKWQREMRASSLARYRELSAAHWHADVVIWPETAIPAFPLDIPQDMAALQSTATAAGTSLLVGMPTRDATRGRYFNSVIAFGRQSGQYDKRHLVPFGEFFPLQVVMRNLTQFLHIPMSDFSAGAPDQVLLPAAGYAAGMSICYEDVFGREVAQALPQAAFLVNVSNDAWFGDTIAPHQHLEIARMRAVETGRYLLRATNTGISAVIDQRGQVTARAAQFEPTVLRASFAARGGATPYVRVGDAPLLSGLCILVIAVLVAARRIAT